MYDPNAPSSLAAIAEYGKPDVAQKLLRYGLWRTQSEADAKDLVADALMRVCDPDDSPWDPAQGTFFRHMRRVMNDEAIEARRRGFGAFETVDSEHEAFEKAVQPIPNPDMLLQAARRLGWLREMWQLLDERLPPDDLLPRRIYELVGEGRHDDPSEFAEALGVSIEEVYEALRRLRRHGVAVRALWEKREAARMAELRALALRDKKKEPS